MPRARRSCSRTSGACSARCSRRRCRLSPGSRAYSPGVPAEIDPDRYPSLVGAARGELRAVRRAAGVHESRHDDDVRRSRAPLSRAFAAYLQALPGAQTRRSRGDHGAEHAAVARRAIRHLARRHGRRERQPDVHDPGARAPARRQRRARRSSCSRISRIRVAAALPNTKVETVIVTRLGDHCSPLKRAVVNFVVKHVKRLVRPWRIRGRRRLPRRARARQRRSPIRRRVSKGSDLAFLQYTGGTTGRAKGAMLTQRNMVANTLQAAAWARPFFARRRRRRRDAVAALPRVLADGEPVLLRRARRPQPADHRSARLQGLRRAAAEAPVRVHDRRQHAVQRAAARAGLRRARLLVAARRAWAAAWPCSATSPTRWQAVTGVRDRAGLRPHRSVADRQRQSAASQGVQRLGRRAVPVDGRRDLRRRRPTSSASARSARSARAARKSWPAIGSAPTKPRKSVRRRLAAHRRRRAARRERASCSSRTARRTSSSCRASRSIRTRSRTSRCCQAGVREAAAIGVPDAQSGEVVKLFVVRKRPRADGRRRPRARARAA